MAKSKFEKQPEQPEQPVKLSGDDIHTVAVDIVQAISHELHIRVGIGPIWRQLNSARKEEILHAWIFSTEKILAESKKKEPEKSKGK